MTYLELVQEATRESGASTEVPSALASVTGLQARFKRWVRQSWKELQMERPDWYFRGEEQVIQNIESASLDEGVRVPTSLMPNTAIPSWNFVLRYDIYLRLQNDATDNPTLLTFIPWNNWNRGYGRSEAQLERNEDGGESGRPDRFTITPTGEMWINPIPDDTYEIQLFGPKKLQELSDDADEPFLPEHYHEMLVWRAVREYGMYHQDVAVAERARANYIPYKKSLDEEYMPQMTLRVDGFYADNSWRTT